MSIFKKIFSHLQAKIVSLLLAIAIWIYVGAGLAQVGNFPGKIPLEVKNTPPNLAAVLDVEDVSVRIVAGSNFWKNLSANSFAATLDLAGFQEGTYDVPVKVVVNVEGVQIVEINPNKVLVRLEKITQKEVPVVLLTQGKAAEGFVVGNWQLKPDRVTVTGASSIVAKVLAATAKITLSGEQQEVQRVIKVVGLDSNGNEIKNLTFSPTEVEATVPLVVASSAKTVGIKVNTIGQVAPGLWVSRIETEPSSVALTASASLINQISFVETKAIDINGLSQNKEFTTTLQLDPGMTILDNVNLIQVKITVSKITSTRQLQTGFSWKNLSVHLRVGEVEPSTATLVLTGEAANLAQIDARDLAINIDLASYSSAGTYSVDISRSDISLPPGISFSSVVPSAITLRLETL